MSIFPAYDAKWRCVLNDQPDFPVEEPLKDQDKPEPITVTEWDIYYLKFYDVEHLSALEGIRNAAQLWEIQQFSNDLYTLRFKNACGFTRLGGLTLKVENRKLSAEQYQNLLDYLAEQYSDLLYSFGSGVGFAHTSQSTGGKHLAYAEWLLLRRLLGRDNDLQSSLNAIYANPHRRLTRENYSVSVDQARHINPQRLLANLITGGDLVALQNGHSLAQSPLGKLLHHQGKTYFPQRISDERIEIIHDTPENRFIKYFLEDVILRLEAIKSIISGKTSYLHPELMMDVETLQKSFRLSLEHPFWQDIGQMKILPSGSMVLQRQEGYRQLFHCYAQLQLLRRYDYALPSVADLLETKNTALLYEYWCFFQVKAILDSFLTLRSTNRLVNATGLAHSLQEGLCLHYEEGTVLCFNKKFSGNQPAAETTSENLETHSYSLELRPDIAIGHAGRWLILDAKNKGIKNKAEVNFYGDEEDQNLANKGKISTFNPEDIHKMHTYRDALHGAVGAFILYPGAEPKKFLKSHQGSNYLGVGALPLRPDQIGNIVPADKESLESLIKSFVQDRNHSPTRSFEDNNPSPMPNENYDTPLFSPSHLIAQMRSPFAAWMDRLEKEAPELLEAKGIVPDEDPMLALLATQGDKHENHYLTALLAQYGEAQVAIIDTAMPRNQQAEHEATIAAMEAGKSVIYQAYLKRENFAGSADFLMKRPGKSDLGDYYYEAWDTKLARSSRPYFFIQLCCYSWMLEQLQGVLPEEAAIVLGDLTEECFRLAKFFSYFLHVKTQFLQLQHDFQADWETMPDPALVSDYGRWGSFATQWLEEHDSLALIANIRKSQIKKLRAAGISTLTALVQSPQTNIIGLAETTFSKLKAQAEMQYASRGQARPAFKLIEAEDGKGLSALPSASNLDVFFDMEGHPLIVGGLEYLWGASYKTADNQSGFKDWWAHTPEQEKAAFEGFIDWAYARWRQDRGMHIYHYASYEVTALRKLSTRYETKIKEVAELLANNVLVDLYRIVRSGLLVGVPSYSIKYIEHLYDFAHEGEVANGGESVVVYENWRILDGVARWNTDPLGYDAWSSDPEHFDWSYWPELQSIRDYNIVDCESTLALVDWLRMQQHKAKISYVLQQDATVQQIELTERQVRNAERKQEILDRQNHLYQIFSDNPLLQNNPIAKLALDLMGFHNRERKPRIWAYFDRLEKTDDELFDDDTCIFAITMVAKRTVPKGIQITGQFDASQPIRKDKFTIATLRGTDCQATSIEFQSDSQREDQGCVQFVISDNIALPEQLTLFAEEFPVIIEKLEKRLCEVTENIFEGKTSSLVTTILGNNLPRFIDAQDYLPINRNRYSADEAYLNAIIRAVSNLDHSCLCIQGPPGAGKTYTATKVIAALVAQNKRIGITSNSHAAILNLLDAVYHETKALQIWVAKIGGDKEKFLANHPTVEFPNYLYRDSMTFTQAQPYAGFSVIGGTVFAFASDKSYEEPFDFLFVDEASQVALANLMAISGAAKNIVLMGDQMQLEQPTQASHPDVSGASALDYLLDGHAVIPVDKGIFLERTYRMHPQVCLPLSEVVYEGKLQAAEGNERQGVMISNSKFVTKSQGILVINTQHEGNLQSSQEEVDLIVQIIAELKTGIFIDKKGNKNSISDADILVVSPYNMQVNLLKDQIAGEIKIGTIDKFQGQEAPIIIVSMAVSDIAESPRGLDFILNINRLNVAVSRAKALAILVVNDGLENCTVTSRQQIENMSFFCRLLNC